MLPKTHRNHIYIPKTFIAISRVLLTTSCLADIYIYEKILSHFFQNNSQKTVHIE